MRRSKPFGVRLAGPLRPTIRHILEDGTHIAVVWDGETTTRDAKPYRNSYVWIFRMDGM
jgi:ketosteroid isomerase-like protein